MADSNTTNYSLTKPEVGASEDTWGTKLNANLDTIDGVLDGVEGKSGAATLKHTDVTKLVTTSTGATITGLMTSDTASITELTADNYVDTVYTLTGTALDPANGNVQTKTMSANTTFTDSLTTGESLVLVLSGGDTYTATYPTMTWAGGTAPTLTSNDALVFWKVGSTLYGAYIGSVA